MFNPADPRLVEVVASALLCFTISESGYAGKARRNPSKPDYEDVEMMVWFREMATVALNAAATELALVSKNTKGLAL